MNREKSTRMYREKRKIKLTYLAMLALLVALTVAVTILLKELNPMFLLMMLAMMLALTLVFILVYRDPATWGWLMFGRGRVFSGNPWQSRLSKELTHMDARGAVEEQMEYEEALHHERPEALTDMRNLREEARERNLIEVPKPDPDAARLGADVLRCPQCDTPYVFDADNPICGRCGTRLHRGIKPSG